MPPQSSREQAAEAMISAVRQAALGHPIQASGGASLQPPDFGVLQSRDVSGGCHLRRRAVRAAALQRRSLPFEPGSGTSLPQRRCGVQRRESAGGKLAQDGAPRAAGKAQAKDFAEVVRLPLALQPRHIRPLHQPRYDQVHLAAAQRDVGVEPRDGLLLRPALALSQRQMPHGLRSKPDAKRGNLSGQGGGQLRDAGREDVQDDVAVVRGDHSPHLGSKAVLL
mmetsp:Transcript_44377/g.128407  ORF Transcript_44377/g.128407 Transcript_44377/m.128407 type:complete len:223 (+) Transcript_44377:248-916(+)